MGERRTFWQKLGDLVVSEVTMEVKKGRRKFKKGVKKYVENSDVNIVAGILTDGCVAERVNDLMKKYGITIQVARALKAKYYDADRRNSVELKNYFIRMLSNR